MDLLRLVRAAEEVPKVLGSAQDHRVGMKVTRRWNMFEVDFGSWWSLSRSGIGHGLPLTCIVIATVEDLRLLSLGWSVASPRGKRVGIGGRKI